MEITLIVCSTFLLVLVAYWIMPDNKMKAVNKELIRLLKILPISRIIEALTELRKQSSRAKESKTKDAIQK